MNAFLLGATHKAYKLVKSVWYFNICIHRIRKLQPHLQDGSQHAGSDALPLPPRQAAANWLKSTFKEADALLTFRLLAHQHTLTWNRIYKNQKIPRELKVSSSHFVSSNQCLSLTPPQNNILLWCIINDGHSAGTYCVHSFPPSSSWHLFVCQRVQQVPIECRRPDNDPASWQIHPRGEGGGGSQDPDHALAKCSLQHIALIKGQPYRGKE